jgi:uncharacterized protein involved in outer membrane biogenesis
VTIRKAFIALGAAVVLVAGAITAALLLVDVDRFRPQVEEQLESRLNRQVDMGRIGLRLFPLSFRVENLTIHEEESFGVSQPFIAAKEVFIRVGLAPLLRRQVQVDSLEFKEPAIELIKNASGVWNYSTLARQPAGTGNKPESAGDLVLNRVAITNGRVAITDLKARKPRVVYDNIDLLLSNFAPGKQYQLEAEIRLPGSDAQTVYLNASGGPMTASNLNGQISFREAPIRGLLEFLKAGSSKAADGVASGDVTFELQDGTLRAKGNLSLSGTKIGYPVEIAFGASGNIERSSFEVTPLEVKGSGTQFTGSISVAESNLSASGSVKNASLPLPAFKQPVTIHSAAFRAERDSATLNALHCSLGPSTLRGDVTVRNLSSPIVDFKVDIDQVNVPEMQQLMVETKQGTQASGGTRKLNGKGVISIGSVRYTNLAVNGVKAACAIDEGVIRLAPVEAEIAGGVLGGSVTVDTRAEHSAYTVDAMLDHVDAKQLLSATTALKGNVTGTLTSTANTRFTVIPGQDIARSLNGQVAVQLGNGRLEGFNIVREMAVLGKFLGVVSQDETFTSVVGLSGTMDIQNGVARTDDLRLQLDGGTATAVGTINLVDQSINLQVTTVLSRELSQRAGGSQAAGLVGTILANENGEFVIPALATGTLAKPRFTPDLARVAEMKLRRVLPRSGSSLTEAIETLTSKPKPGEKKRPLDSIWDILKQPAQPKRQPRD